MFDDRILQLGIEVNGQMLMYQGANIQVKFKKTSDSKQNDCDLEISNLLMETVDYLVTETSPYNPKPEPKLVTILAGRASTGVERVFTGDITSSIPSGPPDRKLQMKAKTQDGAKYTFVSINSPKTIQLSELSKKISDSFGLKLTFEADDKTVSNYLYNGPLAKQIKKLELVGDIDAYIDDDVLVVKNLGKGLKGEVRVISDSTGMIGVPSLDEKGVKVRVMFDPSIKLGHPIEIQSKVNKAANGQYVIYEMAADLATRGQPWYWDLSCNNDNIKSIAEKRAAQKKKDAESERSKDGKSK